MAFALALPVWAAEVPRPSPEFAVTLPNGQQLLVSQFRGKVVALEFLLTTCPHCQNASRILNKLYNEYRPKGFQPIGVAFNDMAMMLVPDYIRDQALTFPVGVAPNREAVMDYLQHPPMMRMLVPQLVFIDRKGVIRAQYSGDDPFFNDEENNMRKQIESLLADGGAAKKSPKKQTKTFAAPSRGVQ